MLAAQRQATILKVILEQGAARISDLAEILKVSEMTVRRDLEILSDEGAIEKVHGGATALSRGVTSEPPFLANSLKELESKDAIGQVAASLIEPGSAIALLGGSTVFSMAKYLRGIERLTIVTNSVPISDMFSADRNQDHTVYLVGGIRTPTDSLVGPLAIEGFQKFKFDVVAVGTHGMYIDSGFSSPNLLEAETNKSVVKNATTFMVLADHSKWGVKGFTTFADLSEANILVSDTSLSPSAIEHLETKVGELHLAKLTESRSIAS